MKSREIADFLRCELVGDPDVEITGVADMRTAEPHEITFIEKASEDASQAGCFIVGRDFSADVTAPLIKAENPKLAFSRIAAILHPPKRRPSEVNKTAVIARTARLGDNVFIGAFVTVGDNSEIQNGTQIEAGVKIGNNVRIGENTMLHANTVIMDGCEIGSSVILHSGVVIGTDGFGYVRDANEHIKFPQIGRVVIEDNVEIGANTCIDRGALGETRIGEGTKIDNLVQIAHNVQIGKRVIIAAQTGISGSTVIEDDCIIGGQVGMGDHAVVKSGAVIGSQAGVLPGKIVRPGVWWGTPVQPLDDYKRQNARIKGLGRLKDEINEIRKKIGK